MSAYYRSGKKTKQQQAIDKAVEEDMDDVLRKMNMYPSVFGHIPVQPAPRHTGRKKFYGTGTYDDENFESFLAERERQQKEARLLRNRAAIEKQKQKLLAAELAYWRNRHAQQDAKKAAAQAVKKAAQQQQAAKKAAAQAVIKAAQQQQAAKKAAAQQKAKKQQQDEEARRIEKIMNAWGHYSP